jgi:predicted porin
MFLFNLENIAMKKFLVTFAILAAAGVASAQSSVTLFGIVDATLQHGSGAGAGSSSKTQLGSGGYSTSRLGFRGREDLGGGMSASFWLEAGINNDNGSGANTNTNNQTTGATGGGGFTFNRRSTVSLASDLGELRLGRDLTPQYLNQSAFDPFGNVGVGVSQTHASNLGGPVVPRASNGMAYFLPSNLGGFNGTIQHYRGENNQTGAATQNDGTGTGIRLGYLAGPINVALATSGTQYATTATTGNIRSTNLGGSWDFGAFKLMALATRDRVQQTTSLSGKGHLLGGLYSMGAGQIRASYSTYESDKAGTPKSRKIALGYVHTLSKRTALYTTFARVTNSGGATFALNGAVTAANARSNGYDSGIRHTF